MNMHADMTAVIQPKCDELTGDDLISGPRTITITHVDIRPGTERPVTITFDGDDGRPFKPCKSVSRVLVAGWGPDAKTYVGRRATLYRDPKVKWGGMEVGGIRISHMSDIDRELVLALTATKGKKAVTTIRPLVGAAPTTSAALSQDQARCDIANAATLDELQSIWRRATMRPHREALQADLDARKSQLTDSPNAEEGRADEDHGDQHDGGPFEGEG